MLTLGIQNSKHSLDGNITWHCSHVVLHPTNVCIWNHYRGYHHSITALNACLQWYKLLIYEISIVFLPLWVGQWQSWEGYKEKCILVVLHTYLFLIVIMNGHLKWTHRTTVLTSTTIRLCKRYVYEYVCAHVFTSHGGLETTTTKLAILDLNPCSQG